MRSGSQSGTLSEILERTKKSCHPKGSKTRNTNLMAGNNLEVMKDKDQIAPRK